MSLEWQREQNCQDRQILEQGFQEERLWWYSTVPSTLKMSGCSYGSPTVILVRLILTADSMEDLDGERLEGKLKNEEEYVYVAL